MEGNRFVAGVVTFIYLMLSYIPGFASCENWIAKLASVQGKVEAKRANATNWQPAKLDNTYCSGDQIRVNANSRAAIILVNETLLRLDQYSVIKLTAINPKQASLIELLKGVGHFISRVPRSLKVETPTMNAAIEGTEFVIAVGADESRITVFEGTVLATNQRDQLRLTSGESAVAGKNTAPKMRLLAKPRNAVQWALYYPPILDPSLKPGEPVYRAASLLNTGRVDEAGKILNKLPDNGQSLALQAILAIMQNHNKQALQLAQRATLLAPDSAATYIALSYAWQAGFKLDLALASAQLATTKAPDNALAWARVAELLLSTGELDEALTAAQKASNLNNALSRTQTVLGYAHLVQIDIKAAKRAFEQAIRLDQTDPLPRLGLGLAKIRNNDLAEGRREIEIAASLDPNSAIVRSYLGKAYFEEKRNPLANEQFDMAKQLDKFDPTPWFYDAIVKQTENRPVEALESLQKSIELNDNRAVYRSSLQLDQDEAARSASLGRIYQDLGFEQLALVEAWKSVNTDPGNHSAHRLLADTYSKLPRHESARVSELLQSQLLQPLNTNPIQPQLSESNLGILDGAGPSETSFSEFNPIFLRNRTGFQLNVVKGSHDTVGDDAVISGVYDNFSYSIGQFHFETDGFRPNNDLKQDIYNIFLQMQLYDNLNVQVEYREQESENGDLQLKFEPDNYRENLRYGNKTKSGRFGFHYKPLQHHSIIGSIVAYHRKGDSYDSEVFPDQPSPGQDVLGEESHDVTTDSSTEEIQYLHTGTFSKTIFGLGYTEVKSQDSKNTLATTLPPLAYTILTDKKEIANTDYKNKNLYMYSTMAPLPGLLATLGISYIDFERNEYKTDKINPKLGLLVKLQANTLLRLAAFSTIKYPLVANQTIEPTQVAGFNQLYDDFNGSKSKRYGIALDHNFSTSMHFGLEGSWRDIETPIINLNTGSTSFGNIKEQAHRGYFFWALNPRIAFSAEYFLEKTESREFSPARLKTERIPLGINFSFQSGFSAHLLASYIDQEYENNNINKDSFWLMDASISFHLPNKKGAFVLGVKNLFDENFLYYDAEYTSESRLPLFQPDRYTFARFVYSI